MGEPLKDLFDALSPEQQQQARGLVQSMLVGRSRRPRRRPTFDWAGSLRDLRDQYTSVELQHQISRRRSGE